MGDFEERKQVIAESDAAIILAEQDKRNEEEASAELAGLSDARFRECKNALELQQLRDNQNRDKETADQKAKQQRITDSRIACLLRWVIIFAVVAVFSCFIVSIALVSYDLLISSFLSEKARSYLTAFVTLGFGMAATRIFDKWLPK